MPADPHGRPGILITRPAEDALAAAQLIAARGYTPVLAPMLNVTRRAVTIPPQAQAILVTSSNALPSLVCTHLPLLAVGDATSGRARAAGFSQVHSAGRDAAALSALAAEILDPARGPVLLASGKRQGHALAAALRAEGFRVLRRTCYCATPVKSFPAEAGRALLAGEIYAATFLSAETAAAFVRLLPPELRTALASVSALVIGPAAASVLETLHWRRIGVARNPTLDDVLALI